MRTADRTYFNSHQMSALVRGEGLQVNSLQSWSPDVITRMGGDGVSTVRSHVQGVGALYSEVQCIMGNGHMGHLPGQNDRQTDTTENITFLQLHFRAAIICLFVAVKV